jgi:methionine-rich copper-binding protein CopC
MKNFDYQKLIKRLIFISFVLVLVNIAYADTVFAANLNNTNTTNITDSYQVNSLNQTNETDTTNLTQTSTNLTQTNNTNNTQTNSSTIKSTNVVQVQSVITVQNIQGVFINPADTPVTSINLSTLKSEGITDIFVYTTRSDPSALGAFITKFAGTGINVYAWVEAFKDFNGNWFSPSSTSTLEKQIIKDITSIATNYNVNGVMLDYLRYPGTAYKYSTATANVDYFALQIRNNINIINNENITGKHKILLSAALMPECSSNAYYYGQNYTQLSNYLDFLSPMIYVGNYKEPASWIGTTVKYIESQANGKPVVAILQTYSSDSSPKPITTSQLNLDIKTAVTNGSDGYELFRYGLITSGFTGYAVVPTIISSNPANSAVYVPKNQVITVTFSKSIMAGSMWIELKNSNGTLIPITISISGKVLTITHPVLSYSKYSLTLHTGSVTDLSGNKLAVCGFSFTVNKIVPKVISTSPGNNAQGVSLTSPITIKFPENILAGTNYSKIYVKNLSTGKVVAITKTISGNTLTIKQLLKRLANNTYEVVIPSAAVKDNKGNKLSANYVFKFKAV